MNPFKFGTVVKNEFFADRVKELELVKQMLESENHLVLISPRRFGKSSLIERTLPTSTAFSAIKRPIKQSYVIKDATYEIEDPFFGVWILKED